MKGAFKVPQAGIDASFELETKEVKEFLDIITPDFVKEFGGILGDSVRNWRFRNEIKILKNTKELVKRTGLDFNKIPLKVLVPLMEASSLEEEETMQNRWSNLLANALLGKIEITPNYVEMLKELSSIEVQILDKIYSEASQKNPQERKNLQFSKDAIIQLLSISSDQAELIIENFYRLNLCRMPGSTGISFGENLRAAVNTTEVFELTSTGFEFVKACREPMNV